MFATNVIQLGKPTCVVWAVALMYVSLEHGFGQDTLQITFDGLPFQPPGTQYPAIEYDESGIRFLPSGSFPFLLRNGGGQANYPNDGTAYLQSETGINFGFTDGRAFDLLSVDLAEFSTVYATSTAVNFVGYHPDGSSVTASFSTDGIIDGSGPLSDFQTFSFDGFTDVVQVQIPSSLFSMDNLIVATPEPSIPILFLLGGAAFYASCIRRKTSN